MSLASMLTAHPAAQYRKNPNFYRQYDGFYLLLFSTVLVTFAVTGFRPLIGGPDWWYLPALPALAYGVIWCHLMVHNATHGNFPKAINRIVGEILGVLVVVRFASWDITHTRHHRYSDDREKDPHPNYPSFWKTVSASIVSIEKVLIGQYYENFGDTPENHAREKRRAWISYGSNLVLIACWLWVMGPWFTVLVWLPAEAVGGLFILHFNWVTHNGPHATSEDDMKPVNLKGFWPTVGNVLFCGIYAHKTHHDYQRLFHPALALWLGRVKEHPEEVESSQPSAEAA